MTSKTAIIFDLDGTLIDSLPSIHAAVNAAMAELNAAPLSLTQVRDFIGHGAPHLTAQVCELRNIPDTRDALARILANYDKAHSLTKPYENAVSVLKQLHQSGYRLGICTNKPSAATETALVHNGMSGVFRSIVSGDTLAYRKPAKEPLLAVVNELGAERAIFVGDSEVDAETAQAAGIPFVLFQRGYLHIAEQDVEKVATFDNYADLPNILASL